MYGSTVSLTSTPVVGEWSAPRPGRFTPNSLQTGAENLAPIVIRSPDHPARSESLYRLSYPGSFRYSNLVNDVHLYEHISSYVHPHCGDVLFLVLPVVALFEMHGRTIPFATCSEEDLPLGALTAYTQ